MPDKCLAHDSCMKEIRNGQDEIKDLLRNGHVVHAQHEQRLIILENSHDDLDEIKSLLRSENATHAQHEQRLTVLETRRSGWDFRNQILRLLFGLAEKAILLVTALAAWAIMKGGLPL